ncbi:MAG: hypothetical protein EA377_07715 [Phycisphaerales bacterium]|nr:MAG: hypothetical protein EA377_07715 [Phycisphaerales bacterium]
MRGRSLYGFPGSCFHFARLFAANFSGTIFVFPPPSECPRTDMLDRLLIAIAHLCCRAPGTILIVGAILAAIAAGYAALKLEMNADTDDLIASDRPFMDNYRAFLDEFGDLEYLYVVIEAGDDPERAKQAVETLGRDISAIEDLKAVFYVIEPAEQLRIATRAMPDEELRELAMTSRSFGALDERVTAGHVLSRANDLLDELVQRGGEMDETEQERAAASGIFLLETFTAVFPDSDAREDLTPLIEGGGERTYLRSDSEELYFVMIMPEKDYGTLSVIEEPLRRIRAVIDETRASYPDVNMGLTGKPVLQADELITTERDMTRAATIAVILVSLLFMIVIGGVWRPLLAVLALGFGIAWTFGLTTLIIGQLNLLSIVFTLVLVGVGIDFGIHLVARYREDLRRMSSEDAIVSTLRTANRANMTGALTSSLAFFMAIFTDFQGLRELGFIAGTGLLLCLVAMTFILPSLLVIYDRKWGKGHIAAPIRAFEHVPKFGDRLWTSLIQRPGTILLVCAVATLLLSPALMRLSFQNNLLELQATGLESVDWEHRILDDSAETWFGAVIVEDRDEIPRIKERAADKETIGPVQSIDDLVHPDTESRARWREMLHEYPPAEPDTGHADWMNQRLENVTRRVRLIAGMARQNDEAEADRLDALVEDLEQLRAILEGDDLERIEAISDAMQQNVTAIASSVRQMLMGDQLELREALPRAVRDRFISDRGRYLVTLHPRENVWEYEPMQAFVEEIRQVDPEVTGVPITQFESLNEMRAGFQKAALLAFLAVFVLLLIDQKSFKYAIFAIVPLLVSLLWLVELMGLLGVQFNLANFFAVPILIGIGVDSGIHIIRRYREDGSDRLHLGATRRAVFMTAVTSMIGFGCLVIAAHRGLQSLGMVMALGSFSCLIASLLILPALLAKFDKSPG